MQIALSNIKPHYMSESELSGSDIYLRPSVLFEQGQSYCVCAHSGHGKTSLLNFIYGVSRAYDGHIVYRPSQPDLFTLRRRHLSYLFQDLALFDTLDAVENVRLKNNLTQYKSEQQMEAMLRSLLPSAKLHQPVGTLSFGQRQRVAVVRALCQPFDFLLLDEPFSHVDNDNARLLAQMVTAEVEAQGAGLIVTALDPIDCFRFDHLLQL